MDALLKSTKSNARGIPEAPFVEKVEDFIKDPNDFDLCFNKFQERLSKYKYMQESKLLTVKQLKQKIPEIENTLNMCHALKKQQERGRNLETNYQLNETLYTTAEIDTSQELKVGLWLGADVMLEYPIDEAISLLNEKLADGKKNLEVNQEDVEYLRENITTMEVNCARLYNWDVEKRQQLKLAQQKA